MGVRIASLLITITNIILTIVSLFIGLRIVLRFISANPATPVVSWIYSVSSSLISPFRGIVADFPTGATAVLDMVAIIALVSYVLVGYLIIEVLRKMAISTTTTEEEVVTTAHYHDIDKDL